MSSNRETTRQDALQRVREARVMVLYGSIDRIFEGLPLAGRFPGRCLRGAERRLRIFSWCSAPSGSGLEGDPES